MKRNIGIYIGSAPGELSKNEGIVKLLLSLIHSSEFRDRIVVALPSWSRSEFSKLLQEVAISDQDGIELLSASKRKPLILSLVSAIKRILKKRKTPKKEHKKIAETLLNLLIKICAKNILLFALIAPVLFVLFSFLSVYKVINFLLPKVKNKIRAFLSKPFLRLFLDPFNKLKEKGLRSRIFAAMREDEAKKLIKLINRRKDIGLWYIPTGYWPEVKKIKKSKVIAIPDIVFHDFPTLFTSYMSNLEMSIQQIQKSLNINAHFLCFSEYVKTEHLMKHYQIHGNKISVIKHGSDNLSTYLQDATFSPTAKALQILEAYQKKSLKDNPYLASYHLPNMKFLFFSSQVRPNKNILNLIKSYELLLRKRFVNVKLILTGKPTHYEPVNSYIHNKCLQNDVLSLFDVSNEVLAALNHLAVCAVNPSFFEGGFPFSFSEAYSVGTPSIMSRIPVVLEESKDETLNSLMLFDPYDVEDMANKIHWGINNREQLLELQKPLYEKFAARSWESAAKEYLDTFDIINLDASVK